MDKLAQIIDGLKEDMIRVLRGWVSIPSVKGDASQGAPFGGEVNRALLAALGDAKALGFEVRNIDGYAGDVRMGPLGQDPLAILAHLDVVPAGDGWQVDPFGAVVENGRIYGRGTSDDKGPAVAALFAMHAIQLAGIPLEREVRLILGCDEESGMEDMAYYAQHCDMPKTGFSPDASFPVINTEKGLLQIELRAAVGGEGLRVEKIAVGERFNVVPGLAEAVIYGDAAIAEKANRMAGDRGLQVTAKAEGEGRIRLISSGVTGHAAYPDAARNASGPLLLVLRDLGVSGPLKTLAEAVGMEYDGLSLGVRCSDETSGPLTCNLGILRYDESGLYATLDIRFPLLANADRLAKTLTATLGRAFDISVVTRKEPHHVAPGSDLVTALLDAYHQETGRPRECVATGGGTYARCLKEGVAFGSAFPEDEELAHQAGEYADIDGLMLNMRIFASAILKLAGRGDGRHE
jgi:succinyl-diaminopimelate desuccinylase